MQQKLDLLEGRHSAGAGLPDEIPVVHYALATAQLDELPAARDGTLDIQNVASKSWDAASETGNTSSKTADVGLVSVHDSEMGL
jgi:hypothetical protein